MSAIMHALELSTSSPAPMAAAIGSSRIYTSEAPICLTTSSTALFSTSVTPLGTPTTTLKFLTLLAETAFSINAFSMSAVLSKSEITPSCSGLITEMLLGALPIICFACVPTARVPPLLLSIAITDGSSSTIPLSLIYINVLAVPKSIPMSFEKKLNITSYLH